MPARSYRIRDVNGAVATKLSLTFRAGKERVSWYELDGKKRFRVVLQQGHSGNYATGTLHSIRKSLQLTVDDFERLVSCPMSGTEFEQHIRGMIERGEL